MYTKPSQTPHKRQKEQEPTLQESEPQTVATPKGVVSGKVHMQTNTGGHDCSDKVYSQTSRLQRVDRHEKEVKHRSVVGDGRKGHAAKGAQPSAHRVFSEQTDGTLITSSMMWFTGWLRIRPITGAKSFKRDLLNNFDTRGLRKVRSGPRDGCIQTKSI